MQLVQRIKKFGELSWKEQLLFSEAYFLHLTTGIILKVIPFKWIPRVFSSPQSAVGSPQSAVFSRQSGEVELIRRAIKRAARVSLWKNRCLVSSLAGRCMLRRRKIGSQVSLGLTKDPNGRVIAHAWLESGKVELVTRSGDYTILYTF